MAATQTLSQSSVVSDKVRILQEEQTSKANKQIQSPVYIPPNEFRMKLLKRILSVDGTLDTKAFKKLQKTSSDRTLQANILFQNGDIGTLISFDRLADDSSNADKNENETSNEDTLPQLQKEVETVEKPKDGVKRERPLKLPPIMLPPIHKVSPKPLLVRDFSGPVCIPPEPTEDDWDDLEDCRYLRPAKKQFSSGKEKKSFLL